MNIAILTTKGFWIEPYCKQLAQEINATIFYNHKEINSNYELVFILGYTKIIEQDYLNLHKYNLVVHESDLPQGKGWAPYFWQVIEGKNNIPIVLFEAVEGVDAGRIYIKDYIKLDGTELYDELRQKQGEKTIELCMRFVTEIDNIIPIEQKGEETFYKKRTSKNSELDINKTIAEQFNLLRTVNNEEFPAFFFYEGQKYILKITKDEPHK